MAQDKVRQSLLTLEARLQEAARRWRDRHIADLSDARIEPFVNLAYTSTLTSYRAVRDHTLNIAEALAGTK